MKDIQLPFVKGFDSSGSPKAYSEPGKLRRAKNLCIRPTQKDALSARNSATLNAALSYVSSECNWRIFECEDRIHLLKPTGISMLNSGENGWDAVSTTRNLDIVSADRYEASSFDVDGSVRNTAIARNSNGDELSVIAGRPSWISGDFAVLAQPYVNGVKRATQSITGTFSSPGQNHWQNVYVFAVGTTGFLIVHGQPAVTSIQFRFYDIATDAFTAVGTVTNSFVLDAVLTNTGRVAVLYRNTVTNYPTVGLFDLSSTPTASATATALHAAGPTTPQLGAMSVLASGNIVHCVLSMYSADSNTVRMYSFNYGTLAVVATASPYIDPIGEIHTSIVVCAKAGVSSETWCYISGDQNGRGALFSISASAVSYSGHAPRIWPAAKLMVPISRAADDAAPYPFIVGTLGGQAGMWRLNGADNPCLMMYSGSRGVYSNNANQVCRSSSFIGNGDAGKVMIVCNKSVEAFEWGLSDTRGRAVTHGGTTVLPMGVPKYWDGASWNPLGISQPPVGTVATNTTGGLSAGAYSVALVWEWTDSRGRRQQSPSTTYSVVATAGQRLDITVYQYSLPADERQLDPSGRPELVEYRTTAGGSTLYRVQRTGVTSSTLWGAGSFTFQDTTTDTFISSREILYTSGGSGELQAFGMEAADMVYGIADRLMWHTPVYPARLFYSKSLRDGRAFEFNPQLYFDVQAPVTAINGQDGNVYSFAEANVYAFAPIFQNDDGTGAVAVDATPVSPGIGTSQTASVIAAPIGLMFRSQRGFTLIPRGGGVPIPFGDVTEGLVFNSCYGAAHNPWTSEIVWVTSLFEQQIMVYNYKYNQWFDWDVFKGSVGLWNGGVVVRKINGFFYFSSRVSSMTLARLDYYPNGTDTGSGPISNQPIETIIETADFAVSDLGRRTRVNAVTIEAFGSATGASVNVDESHDQGATYSNTVTLDVTTGEPLVYQVLRRKTPGLRLRIRATTATIATQYYGMVIRAKSLGAHSVTSAANRKG